MQPQVLAQRVKAGKAPVIVDVRTGMEFRRGHIPGALHVPTWKILLFMAPLPPDKRAEMVVLCELGPRAMIAKGLLRLLGYRSIALLQGHMAGWRRSALPLQK